MKPRLSRSRDSDLVNGDWGEPARTTTSVLAPFFALFALRLARSALLCRHMMIAPVPTKATIAADNARCSETQCLQISMYFKGTAWRGGGGGAGFSYSHGELWMVSRMDAAMGYSRSEVATALKCFSMESAMRLTSFVMLSRSGIISSREASQLSQGSEELPGI